MSQPTNERDTILAVDDKNKNSGGAGDGAAKQPQLVENDGGASDAKAAGTSPQEGAVAEGEGGSKNRRAEKKPVIGYPAERLQQAGENAAEMENAGAAGARPVKVENAEADGGTWNDGARQAAGAMPAAFADVAGQMPLGASLPPDFNRIGFGLLESYFCDPTDPILKLFESTRDAASIAGPSLFTGVTQFGRDAGQIAAPRLFTGTPQTSRDVGQIAAPRLFTGLSQTGRSSSPITIDDDEYDERSVARPTADIYPAGSPDIECTSEVFAAKTSDGKNGEVKFVYPPLEQLVKEVLAHPQFRATTTSIEEKAAWTANIATEENTKVLLDAFKESLMPIIATAVREEVATQLANSSQSRRSVPSCPIDDNVSLAHRYNLLIPPVEEGQEIVIKQEVEEGQEIVIKQEVEDGQEVVIKLEVEDYEDWNGGDHMQENDEQENDEHENDDQEEEDNEDWNSGDDKQENDDQEKYDDNQEMNDDEEEEVDIYNDSEWSPVAKRSRHE